MGMGFSGGMGQQYQPQGQAGGMPQMSGWFQDQNFGVTQTAPNGQSWQDFYSGNGNQLKNSFGGMFGQPGMGGIDGPGMAQRQPWNQPQQPWGGMPPLMQQQPMQNGWGMQNFNPPQNQQINYDQMKAMQAQAQQFNQNNPTAPQHTTPMPPPGRTTGYFGGDAMRNKMAQQQKRAKQPMINPMSNPMNAAMGGFNRGFK